MGAAFGLAAALAAHAGAATIKVDCARASLQKKIDSAPAGSTLLVKGTCTGQFTIGKSLTLDGDPRATLDAADGGRTLTIAGAPSVRLVDLRITGGNVRGQSAQGGGIFHPDGSLVLKRVAVVGNTAAATGTTTGIARALGGGIYSERAGRLALTDSSVRRNAVTAAAGTVNVFGGGIFRLGSLALVRSSVTRNRVFADSSGTSASSFGGGVYVDEGALSLRTSRVDRNRATADGPGGPSRTEGGGIFLSDGLAVRIRASTVRGNRATASTGGTSAIAGGGGIAGALTRGTIGHSVLAGNSARALSTGDAAAAGGGGWITSGTALSVLSSRIAANAVEATGGGGAVSGSGGGLSVENDVTLRLRRATVDRNTVETTGAGSDAWGGGIDVVGDLFVQASTVSRNVASAGGQGLGGGVRLPGSTAASITNSTIAGNRASGTTARGGGIDTFAAAVAITSSTVARNTAKLGGGLYVEQGMTALAATIVGANTAPSSPDCGGEVESSGRNLIGKTGGCAFGARQSDTLDTAAKIGILGAHGGPTQTIPLRAASPALDAIPKAACAVARDQRGVRRPQGARCDIGAFERMR